MINNNKNTDLNINEQIFSIFNDNLPRKIVYNSFINNNTPIRLNEQFGNCYNQIDNDKNQVSIFNPYDNEIEHKFNNVFNGNNILTYNKAYKKNNEKGDEILDNNNNWKDYIFPEENEENKDNEDLFIQKVNNYINISSDNENNLDKNCEEKIQYISPKLHCINNNKFKKIAQYSINNPNDKDLFFTDLKKGLNNMKIKSTNFSSNVSYENKDPKNNNKKEISALPKINFFNINKNNKKIKRIKFQDNTIIKENKTDHNKKDIKKIPKLRSTIQYSKTLKTIDEYMELKRKYPKSKNSPSKKRENNHHKTHILHNLSSIKSKSNKKERIKISKLKDNKKSQKKNINININKDIFNKDDETVKANNKDLSDKNKGKNINDEIKKGNTKIIKKNKSNPKITMNKCFFRSFLCCFGIDNCEEVINTKKVKSPKHKVNNTDINNNKLNDKKGKNKSGKKKKNKKISD